MTLSLADKAYQLLRTDITTCVLRPGQQVVQSKLAEAYQIGVTPIRDALQRLAQDKLVQPIPRSGYVIAPITLSGIHEMFELRSLLESYTARTAAARGIDEQIEVIARLADVTYVFKDKDSYLKHIAANAEFHCAIAVAAGNQRVVELISGLLDELSRLFYLSIDLADRSDEMREEHHLLARAICDRDPERAAKIAGELARRAHQRALEALNPPLDGNRLGSVEVDV